MTPFPEGEDMTVKRLYVALKRGDEQLLKMGAHKLHEKYYSGFEFKMFDELKDILNRLNEQRVPNDIKDLLTRTITNILNGVKPEYPTTPAAETQEQKLQIKSENQTIQTPLGPIQAQTAQNSSTNTIQLTPQYETREEQYRPQENTPYTASPAMTTAASMPMVTPAPTVQPVKDIIVFYDDKAGFIDYDKNKLYRHELNECELNRESNPIKTAAHVKSAVDTRVDELKDVFYSLKNLQGNIDFITSSKSAEILNMFSEFNIKFAVSGIEQRAYDTKTMVYPLFGLSNIFVCPKCGKKECFTDKENRVLSLQCPNCTSSMLPDVYEAKDFDSTATPYNWLRALTAMAKTGTWVLINPPLGSSRALTCEFLRTALTACKPKKVCIVSKDTAIKEYYRQMIRETVENCEVKSEFANTEMLLGELTKDATLQAV